jgi:acetyltransferase
VDGAEVRLRTGDTVRIRPIHSTDAVELQRAFALMSEESQHQRFLTGMPRLTDSQAAYFTAVDHVDHVAYVAHATQDASYIIGVARFIRYASAPDEAELAITIADSWHGLGLGTVMLRRLCERAREVRVRRLRAEMMPDNEGMLRLLRSAGMVDETQEDGRVVGHLELARED